MLSINVKLNRSFLSPRLLRKTKRKYFALNKGTGNASYAVILILNGEVDVIFVLLRVTVKICE